MAFDSLSVRLGASEASLKCESHARSTACNSKIPGDRGCSELHLLFYYEVLLVPAQAGMLQVRSTTWSASSTGPRVGGDAPHFARKEFNLIAGSSRMRGCSGLRWRNPLTRDPVPTHAGMIRSSPPVSSAWRPGPCAGGDAPMAIACGGMGSARSPRRRGCSESPVKLGVVDGLVPAQAGMLRPRPACWPSPCPGPRAGGDAPSLDNIKRLPMARSPRRRGCSEHDELDDYLREPVPAQAGMLRSSGP
jgi:hypothetical protein